jgi:hypothetical protein
MKKPEVKNLVALSLKIHVGKGKKDRYDMDPLW